MRLSFIDQFTSLIRQALSACSAETHSIAQFLNSSRAFKGIGGRSPHYVEFQPYLVNLNGSTVEIDGFMRKSKSWTSTGSEFQINFVFKSDDFASYVYFACNDDLKEPRFPINKKQSVIQQIIRTEDGVSLFFKVKSKAMQDRSSNQIALAIQELSCLINKAMVIETELQKKKDEKEIHELKQLDPEQKRIDWMLNFFKTPGF